MWRKVVTQAMPGQQQAVEQTLQQPVVEQPTSQQQELAQLLLPRPPRTRSLGSLLSFWAPTSRGSTTRAACFFQHVSATTWLRAS
jgi:hypothetical protein